MTGPRIDTGLTLPDISHPPPMLKGAEGLLALPGPAGPGPFLVEAGDVQITGSERDGVERVRIGSVDVLTDLATGEGAAANVLATPGGLRRECIGPLGSTQEIVLLPGTGSTAAVQWQTGQPEERAFSIRFTLAPGMSAVSYRTGEQTLVVKAGSPDSEAHAVVLDPPPTSWTAVEAEGGGLEIGVETTVAKSRPVTLLVATTSKRGAQPGAVLRHLDLHEIRAHAPLEPDEAGVRLATGVADLDHGLGWLTARIRSCSALDATDPDELLWWGLGALASAQHEAAERVHDRLLAQDPFGPQGALLAARIALTTGHTSRARTTADSLDSLHPQGPLAAAAWSALADALRYAAPEQRIQRLRDASAAAAARARGLGLPMVGRAEGPDPLPVWLATAIARCQKGDHRAAADTALIGSLARSDPESYGRWRIRVAEGLAAGPAGRGTWDPAGGSAANTGALACGLIHGMLGWDSDAPVGRLTLAPRLPRHVTTFSVQGLHVGDAQVTLDYSRQDDHLHEWVLTPTAGRVPPTLVFRPELAASDVASVTVDGAAAELDIEKTRDRVALSAQIPLDRPRTVRVATSENT